MRVTNKSRNVVLADRAGLARTFYSRVKGLLGRGSLSPGEGLIIIPCSSIHTIGMFFSIDAVFFDRDNRAVAVLKDLRPYRITRWYPKAKGVLELPAGAVTDQSLMPGDELDFSD